MMDGSACEVIDTGTIKVTERDGTVYALEAVWYVPKHGTILISIGVLDKEGNYRNVGSQCSNVKSQFAKMTR